ncbi:hypothetical protein [Tautonia rosea]|uniref:hypothetical protein n=1 Tax=Tautonia rosea TaxID=2728037 RepID=UPI0014728BA0|nr:hypothetical protein [Tautonia rosea]
MGLAFAVILPIMAWQWWQGSIEAERTKAIALSVAEMEEASLAGDLSEAFLAAEAARTMAIQSAIEPPGGLDRLTQRRDELARAEVTAQLDRLPDQPAQQGLQQAQAIADRVASDPALDALKARSEHAISEAAQRWTDLQLTRAEAALGSDNPAEALALAHRLASDLDLAPAAPVAAVRDRLRSFVAKLVETHGIRIEPIDLTPGPLGPPGDAYLSDLRRLIQDGLLQRGYLVAPPDSSLADLWVEAPFRFESSLTEQYGASYLQSPHQTTMIRTELVLEQSGRILWSDYFEARTRVPLPGLSAMESSRLEIGTEASPEIEKRFARDARADLIEKLIVKLRSFPVNRKL